MIIILGWRGYYLGENHRNNPRDDHTFRLRHADNLEIGVRGKYNFFWRGHFGLYFIGSNVTRT
jgi:hypothetical protein